MKGRECLTTSSELSDLLRLSGCQWQSVPCSPEIFPVV